MRLVTARHTRQKPRKSKNSLILSDTGQEKCDEKLHNSSRALAVVCRRVHLQCWGYRRLLCTGGIFHAHFNTQLCKINTKLFDVTDVTWKSTLTFQRSEADSTCRQQRVKTKCEIPTARARSVRGDDETFNLSRRIIMFGKKINTFHCLPDSQRSSSSIVSMSLPSQSSIVARLLVRMRWVALSSDSNDLSSEESKAGKTLLFHAS